MKGKHSLIVGDIRPISCCNGIYKAISMIIAERLSPFLDGLIDKAQGAFIPSQSMANNIFLAQELIMRYKRKRISSRAIIKIHLRKAFDTIEWDFSKEMLSALIFPPKLVRWIVVCLRTPAYTLAISEGTHVFFLGKQSLRQGDSLSPTFSYFLLSTCPI